jgi:hypothetical protein
MIRSLFILTVFALGCGETRAGETPADETPPAQGEVYTASDLSGFTGAWKAVSDDGTNIETAEIEVSDGVATGMLKSIERGYYSGRMTVTAEVAIRGTLRDAGLDLQAWNTNNGPETAVTGRAFRRGEYLIVRIGDGETDYARPDVPLVVSGEGSAAAMTFAQEIGGRIYSSSSQASGSGAFVGNRVRLALCADGTIAYDASDVATTGGDEGVDMGSTASRRGEWSVVLLAGLPVVRAQWNGTGSSYSLTRYFRIQPGANGSGASVDGVQLPVTGSC